MCCGLTTVTEFNVLNLCVPSSDSRSSYTHELCNAAHVVTEKELKESSTMETQLTRWILILQLIGMLALERALGLQCYYCSSLDSPSCSGDFNQAGEGVQVVECQGSCYKSVYDYLDAPAIKRGCEPSTDCPGTCFGNDCPFCCQESLCNNARRTTVTSSVVFMGLLATVVSRVLYMRD